MHSLFFHAVRPSVRPTGRPLLLRHGYERRRMMEIRNKLVNWRRRRRPRSTDRGSYYVRLPGGGSGQ